MPFADAEFDACRAERLFQVLPAGTDPQALRAGLAGRALTVLRGALELPD